MCDVTLLRLVGLVLNHADLLCHLGLDDGDALVENSVHLLDGSFPRAKLIIFLLDRACDEHEVIGVDFVILDVVREFTGELKFRLGGVE